MPGTTPEGLPYPLATEPVRDGAVAAQNTATAVGVNFPYPVNTSNVNFKRVGLMLSQSLAATFDANGRWRIDVSGTFSSVITAFATSSTFPIVFSCTSVVPSSVELFGKFPSDSLVVGAVTLRLMIIGIRK